MASTSHGHIGVNGVIHTTMETSVLYGTSGQSWNLQEGQSVTYNTSITYRKIIQDLPDGWEPIAVTILDDFDIEYPIVYQGRVNNRSVTEEELKAWLKFRNNRIVDTSITLIDESKWAIDVTIYIGQFYLLADVEYSVAAQVNSRGSRNLNVSILLSKNGTNVAAPIRRGWVKVITGRQNVTIPAHTEQDVPTDIRCHATAQFTIGIMYYPSNGQIIITNQPTQVAAWNRPRYSIPYMTSYGSIPDNALYDYKIKGNDEEGYFMPDGWDQNNIPANMKFIPSINVDADTVSFMMSQQDGKWTSSVLVGSMTARQLLDHAADFPPSEEPPAGRSFITKTYTFDMMVNYYIEVPISFSYPDITKLLPIYENKRIIKGWIGDENNHPQLILKPKFSEWNSNSDISGFGYSVYSPAATRTGSIETKLNYWFYRGSIIVSKGSDSYLIQGTGGGIYFYRLNRSTNSYVYEYDIPTSNRYYPICGCIHKNVLYVHYMGVVEGDWSEDFVSGGVFAYDIINKCRYETYGQVTSDNAKITTLISYGDKIYSFGSEDVNLNRRILYAYVWDGPGTPDKPSNYRPLPHHLVATEWCSMAFGIPHTGVLYRGKIHLISPKELGPGTSGGVMVHYVYDPTPQYVKTSDTSFKSYKQYFEYNPITNEYYPTTDTVMNLNKDYYIYTGTFTKIEEINLGVVRSQIIVSNDAIHILGETRSASSSSQLPRSHRIWDGSGTWKYDSDLPIDADNAVAGSIDGKIHLIKDHDHYIGDYIFN